MAELKSPFFSCSTIELGLLNGYAMCGTAVAALQNTRIEIIMEASDGEREKRRDQKRSWICSDK